MSISSDFLFLTQTGDDATAKMQDRFLRCVETRL